MSANFYVHVDCDYSFISGILIRLYVCNTHSLVMHTMQDVFILNSGQGETVILRIKKSKN